MDFGLSSSIIISASRMVVSAVVLLQVKRESLSLLGREGNLGLLGHTKSNLDYVWCLIDRPIKSNYDMIHEIHPQTQNYFWPKKFVDIQFLVVLLVIFLLDLTYFN